MRLNWVARYTQCMTLFTLRCSNLGGVWQLRGVQPARAQHSTNGDAEPSIGGGGGSGGAACGRIWRLLESCTRICISPRVLAAHIGCVRFGIDSGWDRANGRGVRRSSQRGRPR